MSQTELGRSQQWLGVCAFLCCKIYDYAVKQMRLEAHVEWAGIVYCRLAVMRSYPASVAIGLSRRRVAGRLGAQR